MSDVRLTVNQKKHGGWKRIAISRAIESVSGSFSLDISDKWIGQNQAWPIGEEDECRVEIDGEAVIDGFVDSRAVSLSGSDRGLSISGRDRSAALVDNSAVLDKWSFKNINVLQLARKVAAPFGINVSMQTGIVLGKPPVKTAISPGDSAWSVIEKAAQQAGVLVVNDGSRGILITRSGVGRAAALVEGRNVLAASVDYNATERFRKYRVVTQIAGTDEAPGSATRIKAEALDLGVRRTERILIIRPETGMSTEFARKRADWEARLRAARAETLSVTVQGWRQPTGQLWPVNALVDVEIPAIGAKGSMLISKVDYNLGSDGETTTLSIVRPDAFTPEPQATVKQTGIWKELAGGAK